MVQRCNLFPVHGALFSDRYVRDSYTVVSINFNYWSTNRKVFKGTSISFSLWSSEILEHCLFNFSLLQQHNLIHLSLITTTIITKDKIKNKHSRYFLITFLIPLKIIKLSANVTIRLTISFKFSRIKIL